MKSHRLLVVAVLLLIPAASLPLSAQTWKFAVAGDSRNCGDVVMPAIAENVRRSNAVFYWHLGDFRAIYDFDEDYRQAAGPGVNIIRYLREAWPDFIQNQMVPFGDLPVFLGIGNHELVPPKTRADYLQQFADWLDAPAIRDQRLRDDRSDHLLKTYYHWIQGGVDFINLDNASPDQFDASQLGWFKKVLRNAESNASVKTVIVGMHEALPDGLGSGHSMNESAQGTQSGRETYKALADFQTRTAKHVYVLASHSHFYMANAYNTACRESQKQPILPGWIVGTAGAVRYRLPQDVSRATDPQTDVYGYLLATVSADGAVSFEFKKLSTDDVPQAVKERFTSDFVNQCFSGNKSGYILDGGPQPPHCP
ncbi:MAG TPA: metallophosphoesterase [Candidatus Acidoferrales bacterium]|nr:metallophosphoesterase [Candidatus Acidoferrales bacterium]